MIRKAYVSDISAIRVIHLDALKDSAADHYTAEQIAFLTSMSTADWQKTLEKNENIFVFEYGNEVVGFASIKNQSVLWHLYVAPSSLRRGIGSALLHCIEKRLVLLGLKTSELHSSLSAVPFYEKEGYKVLETVTLKHAGIRAVHMTKLLIDNFSKEVVDS